MLETAGAHHRTRLVAVAALTVVALQAGAPLGSARAQREPRTPRPGEGIEAVPPDSFRDGGASALLNAVLPPPPPPVPPPPAAPCPEPPRCVPDSDLSQVAWIIAGLSTAAMLVAGWWGVTQLRRTRIYREELSRIRIQRTSAIRTGRKLGEVQMPPHGLGKRPEAEGRAAPAPSSPPAPTTAEPSAAPTASGSGVVIQPTTVLSPPTRAPAPRRAASPATPTVDPVPARVREEAEARLAMAQAPLEPLLRVVRSVEEWFRTPEYEAALVAAGAQRGLLDRLHRGVVAASATFHALREARIYPATPDAIDDELERYWEQVYESLDDVNRLVALASSDEARGALESLPAGESLRAWLIRLVEAAHAYLGSDGRRPIPTEPLVTDFDRRLHVAVESRRVDGVPPGKVLAVLRGGIAREGRPLRKPEVVVSV